MLFAILTLPIAHDEQMIKNKQELYLSHNPCPEALLKERNESGETILHIMSLYGYEQLVEGILAQTPTKDLAFIPNNFTQYPIHTAILHAQHACASLLMSVEGVALLTDIEGRNALHYAAQYGDREMIKICLTAASKDSLDIHKQTPLILAVIANNLDAVEELLLHEPEINALDELNHTALHYALELNYRDIVRELLKYH